MKPAGGAKGSGLVTGRNPAGGVRGFGLEGKKPTGGGKRVKSRRWTDRKGGWLGFFRGGLTFTNPFFAFLLRFFAFGSSRARAMLFTPYTAH